MLVTSSRVPAGSVDVRTERYEFAHGHTPRGRGYWMFGFGHGVTYREAGFTGMYTEAKKRARKFAGKCGSREVTVLS